MNENKSAEFVFDLETPIREGADVELRQGDYWRATRLVDSSNKRKIPRGQVHLLLSIREDTEGAPHTIILALHPREEECYGHDHRFLVDDFISNFEWISQEEAKEIRSREVAAIQVKVAKKQQELMDAQSNPEMLLEAVRPEIEKWETTNALKKGSTGELPFIDPEKMALSPTITSADVDNIRLSITRKGEESKAIANWFKAKATEISSTIQKTIPYMQEQAVAAIARTEDITRYVKRLTKGVDNLSLYVLADVTIIPICEGISAPDDVKLAIRQSKLYMDEELSVFAEVEEGFDFRKVGIFREYLASHPALADQIFPSQRAVVCMATTRRDVEYGRDVDTYTAANWNAWNHEVFLLVRDGGNIYEVVSPTMTHKSTERLFPSRDEIDRLFRDEGEWWDSEKKANPEIIPYMSVKYTDRLLKHDDLALHYKRFLMLLMGLDHYKNLFGTFHNKPQSMEFMSFKFQREYMDFLHDDEYNRLQLPGEVNSFITFAHEQNALLRSGSRVICQWGDCMNPKTIGGALVYEHDRGRGYDLRVISREKHSVRIAYESKGSICVKAPCRRNSYDSNAPLDVVVKLSEFRYRYYDSTLGFLVLDRVKADQIHAFIHDRTARVGFINYISLFKAAIQYLRAEEEREAPIKASLASALKASGTVDISDQEMSDIIDTAVVAWRAANRGAEIPPPSDVKYKQLLNQIFALAKQDMIKPQIPALAEKIGEKPLRVTIGANSQIFLYTEVPEESRDHVLFPHPWVNKRFLRKTKDGLVVDGAASLVALPSVKTLVTETLVQEWDNPWSGVFVPLRHDSKLDLMKTVDEVGDLGPLWLRPTWDRSVFDITWANWLDFRDVSTKKWISDPNFYMPLGILCDEIDSGGFQFRKLVLRAPGPPVLYNRAPTEEDRIKVVNVVSKRYTNRVQAKVADKVKEEPISFFVETLKDKFEFETHRTGTMIARDGAFVHSLAGVTEAEIGSEIRKLAMSQLSYVKEVRRGMYFSEFVRKTFLADFPELWDQTMRPIKCEFDVYGKPLKEDK